MTKKNKSPKNTRPRERRERRLLPRPNASASVIYLVGAIGAAAMGAGAWEELGSTLRDGAPDPVKIAPYVLAIGALLVGVAIWIGTSGEPPLRVGDGGLAVEKGGIRRMSWYAIDNIEWRDEGLRVTGKDDAGAAMTLTASLANHPQAAAWIVKEARERVPAVVHVPDDATLPTAQASAGSMLALEPPQVVGKHCATSGKVIAYEPDARVCPKCERVYHKAHVPEACECGASLVTLRAQAKTA
ncbi:MAG: hypothetical protein ACLP1X_09090 [Polyangiaceae bacterium]